MLGAAACSDDEKAEDATTTTEAHGTTAHDGGGDGGDVGAAGGDVAVSEEACGAYAELSAAMTGDPSGAGPALETLEQALPESLAEAGATVTTSLSAAFEGDQDALGSPEFTGAFAEIGDAMFLGCESDAQLDVTGIDYGFEGLPEELPAGTAAVRFTNRTSHEEPHELIIAKRNDGTTESLDELAEMNPDELMEKVTMAGVAFADAADSSSTSFMELEPGTYVAICTIPVGGGESGPAHATSGMIGEFQVVAS